VKSDPISYRVRPVAPYAHLFEVELRILRPDPNGQVLTLPAWIPGSYMIRDFARHIVEITAFCGNDRIAIDKLDKQTWRAAPCQRTLHVRYRVYCWDLSVRGAHLDTTHGYFNGTSLFLTVRGQEQSGHGVILDPPGSDVEGVWRVATTLARNGAERYGFGAYRADSYAELIDHPVEMGEFTLVEFSVCGVPHAMAISGHKQCDCDRLAHDLQSICETHVALFGEPPPMNEYLFLTMVVSDGYGGLEHRNSCSLLCSRNDLPHPNDSSMSEGYRNFLSLCSHEYFHLWNVKRIRPTALHNPDLSREVHTPLLWAFEGITSYYDDLALVRAGLIDHNSYLQLLARNITRVLRNPGRLRQSLADSSFDAWTKFYKPDANTPNAVVSYYSKGALVALLLDLTIREASDQQRSLDDLMRALWQRHGMDQDEGVTSDGFEALASEIADIDLQPFFERWVRGTDELELVTPLRELAGVELQLRSAEGELDKGGSEANVSRTLPWIGARIDQHSDDARITTVLYESPAQQAGLAAGDVIIAVDGLRVRRRDFETQLHRFQPGDRITIHAFRHDTLRESQVALAAAPADTAWFTLTEGAVAAQQRHAWLSA